MKFLQGIGTFIANIFSGIFNFILNIFKGIFNFIKSIINGLVSIFQRNYPKEALDLSAVIQAIIVAAITMAVIFIFDPFKLNDVNQILITGAIAFVISLLFSFITSFLSKGSWTLLNQLLKQLIVFVVIALACMIYVQKGINIESLGIFALVSMIPTILHVFFNQNMAESKYSNLAIDLNEKLKSTKVSNELSKTITIENKNGNNLNLLPNQIISVEEKNGSVEITWQNLFNTEITTVQNSLKSIENSLAGNVQFAKCNATTLVNVYAIKNANGNAHGLELAIAKSNQTINVARNKVNLVQNIALGK
jgi:hypothetical protein